MKAPDEELHTEVLVVGSGPGGAVTAAALADAGLHVTIVEEGDWSEPGKVTPYSRDEMVTKYRNQGMTLMVGLPPINYVEARCAGGGSEVNSGLFHRPNPESVARWATEWDIEDLDPDDLDRHAADIEQALAVSSVPGPAPQLSQVLDRGARRLGWAVNEVPRWYRHEPGDDSYRSGERQTMSRTFLPRATKAGATLVTGCRVRRLRRTGTDVVAAECTVDGRRRLLIHADHVFVCAGAIQTPALLQRSGFGRRFGKGLGAHPTLKMAARFPEPFDDNGIVAMHQVKQWGSDLTLGGSASRPGYVGLALGDGWAANRIDGDDWARMGVYYASIRSEGKGRVIAVPGVAEPVVTYRLTEADMSRLAFGLVQLGELLFAAGADRVYPALIGAGPIDSPAGLHGLWDQVTRAEADLMTVHLFASMRMSRRPELAATDSFGQVHGFRNLYVNDSSLLPDAAGVNPQGTIMAIAARNAERYLQEQGTPRRMTKAP